MAETPPLIRMLSTRIEENPTPHQFDPFEEVLAVMEEKMERHQDEVMRRYPGDLVDRLFTPDGELDLHIGTTHNLMQKTMPRILHLLGSLFTSKTKNRESTQSLRERENIRSVKLKQATVAAEILLQQRFMGKAVGTPHYDVRSISSKLMGTVRSQQDLLSSLYLGRSSRSLDHVKSTIYQNGEKRYQTFLDSLNGGEWGKDVSLLISDNLNPSMSDRFGSGSRIRLSSINTLLASLTTSPLPAFTQTSFFNQFNQSELKAHLSSLGPDLLDPSFERIYTKVCEEYLRLYDFTPHPLIEGQSSSASDIQNLILNGIMRDELDVVNKPGVLVVDPEPFNILMSSVHTDPRNLQKWKYLIPMIELFHLRMHFLKGVILDPHTYLLLFQHITPLFHKSKLDEDKRMKATRLVKCLPSTRLPTLEKNKISHIRYELLGESQPDSDRTDVESVFFGDIPAQERRSEEDARDDLEFILTGHLCDISTRRGTKRGWSEMGRKEFTFPNDPKKVVQILRTFHKAWAPLVATKKIPTSTTCVGIQACWRSGRKWTV